MPTPFPPESLTTFRSLADVVYTGESFESVYGAICRAAVEFVDGCDHASLMLRRHGRSTTAASSDDVARRCDGLELELGEGPCIDAMEESEPNEHLCADLDNGSKWPELAARIRAETPVRGMAGLRLRQDGQKVGALNLFSDTPGRPDADLARPGDPDLGLRLDHPGGPRPGRGGRHAAPRAGQQP